MSRRLHGLVMEAHEPAGAQRDEGVCAAMVVAEFDLERAGVEPFDHSSDLTAAQSVGGKVAGERHDVQGP